MPFDPTDSNTPKIVKLTNNEKGDFTHVLKLDYLDMIAIGTTATAVGSLAKWQAVETAYVIAPTAIAGITDVTLNVGTTVGDPDEFVDNVNVYNLNVSLAPSINSGDAFNVSNHAGLIAGETSVGASTIYVKLGGTPASLTAGEVLVGLRILDLERFSTL